MKKELILFFYFIVLLYIALIKKADIPAPLKAYKDKSNLVSVKLNYFTQNCILDK